MPYTIVIDAGHGGSDPGAVYEGRREKDDNLSLAMAVGELLSRQGVSVIYTRTTDVYQTPFEKAQMANQADADFFIYFQSIFFIKSYSFNMALIYIIIFFIER